MRGRYLDTHTDNHLSTSKLLRCPVAEIDKLRKLSRNKWRCKDALCIFCYASKWQIKNLLLKFLFAMHNFQLEQNRVKLRTAELEKGVTMANIFTFLFHLPTAVWKSRFQRAPLEEMAAQRPAVHERKTGGLSPLEPSWNMYTHVHKHVYYMLYMYVYNYICMYVCMYITIYVHYMYITLQPLEPHQIKWMLWELLFTMACV